MKVKSFGMKVLVALMPAGVIAIAYALAHGNMCTAETLVPLEGLAGACYRSEVRLQRRLADLVSWRKKWYSPLGKRRLEGSIRRLLRQARTTFAATLLLMALTAAVPANAADASPLVGFLLRPGEMSGFTPGNPRVFRTIETIETASGEKPTALESKRYAEEGFVEAAIVRMHSKAEPAAKGISSVFQFETRMDARAEMKAELKEEIDPATLRKEKILKYLDLRHFRVPGVPEAVAYAFVSNRASEKLGVEAGVAKGLLVEGNCLLSIGVGRLKSKEVVDPVVNGVQAIFNRSGGICS